jgi:hypothetical protein
VNTRKLSEEAAKKSTSLKLMQCYRTVKTLSGVTFTRVSYFNPQLPHDNLYLCCPGLLELLELRVVEPARPDGAAKPIVFSIMDVVIAYCPCCREPLQLKEAVELRMARIRDKKGSKAKKDQGEGQAPST